MKKHILVVSQYFHPENFRINDICCEWVKRGYKVTVITGIPNYPEGKFYKGYGFFKKRRENYQGIDIYRLPIISRGKKSLRLIMNYFSFVFSGFIWKTFTRIKPDLVFCYEVSPMTQVLPAMWLAKRRKSPLFVYITDLWPENLEIVAGVKSKFVLKRINKMVDKIYKKSSMIFTSSESFINSISKRGVPKEKLKFWPQYAEGFYEPLQINNKINKLIPQDDFFNIIFAGNIGYAQGLGILPEVSNRLVDNNLKVRFSIVGDGRFKKDFIQKVQDRKLCKNFNFIDRKPANEIPEMISLSDATLIMLSESEVFSITIPAKTQSCLACGKPVLVSANGEVCSIINKSKSGLCSSAGNIEELVQNIIKLVNYDKVTLCKMGKNAINCSNMNFSKDKILSIMDDYIIDYTEKGKV